jgi:pantoate--beta-alanine ligase
VGLVPTMGALHRGHLSLIECCKSENAVTVVSIFVNPTQFNDPEDLKNYPRNLERDIGMLRESGCDMLFVPGIKTIYPRPDLRIFDFGGLERRMEGQFRPGHFNGVAQVVSRLFDIIKPDRAYFGKKDIQQLAIIRKLTTMLNSNVEIRACETLREDDGLAMSSRNVLLSAGQRKNAAIINRTLREAARKRGMEVGELKQWVADVINDNPFFELEYFEIVGSSDLQIVNDWSGSENELIACIAVRAGRIRLIDNVFFPNFALL